MTRLMPEQIYTLARLWLSDVEKGGVVATKSTTPVITNLSAEVVRLHDALAAWWRELDKQVEADSGVLDETWITGSDVLKMLHAILYGVDAEAQP